MKLKSLLIADDQLGIRLLLSEVFKREGYKIFLAANGIEAIQIVKDEQPDCILLDMEMPGMNGDEVLKKIKSDPVFKIIPVIMISGNAFPYEINESYRLGVNSFILKPSTHELTLKVISTFMDYWLRFVELPDVSMLKHAN